MTTASRMLEGVLPWEKTTDPAEALWLTADLTEYLICHGGFQRGGRRALEAGAILRRISASSEGRQGFWQARVQVSAAARMLASRLLGRRLDAEPGSREQHASWWQTIEMDLKIQYRRYDTDWLAQVLAMLRAALAWEEDEQPSPRSFFRDCIRLANLTEIPPPLPKPRAGSRRTPRWSMGLGGSMTRIPSRSR